uniref:Uncharacterized protein n=1 Tax=Anguilla anguilla TaxID=7936 RepID=A0A0E9U469_ANGAN
MCIYDCSQTLVRTMSIGKGMQFSLITCKKIFIFILFYNKSNLVKANSGIQDNI